MVEREGHVSCCGGRKNGLIEKWGNVADQGIAIGTWTEKITLCYLAELASKSQFLLEIGTYTGASAKVMLLANPKLILFCIDTFECKNEPKMVEYLKSKGVPDMDIPNLTTFDVCSNYSLKEEFQSGRCSLIKAQSDVGAKLLKDDFGEGWLDAIWCDDGHLETDLVRDITHTMPLLKNGHEFCGHDWDGDNNVSRGVLSVLPAGKISIPLPRLWSYIKP